MKLIDISTPKHPNTFAMVDDEDFDRINAHKWSAIQPKGRRNIYATRDIFVNGRRTSTYMHREILGESAPRIVDHKDRNSLNNQKYNLRPATGSQNSFNSSIKNHPNKASKYRGVKMDKRSNGKRWVASISRKKIYLGTFPTEELAYTAYLNAARSMYGEFVPPELFTPTDPAEGGKETQP